MRNRVLKYKGELLVIQVWNIELVKGSSTLRNILVITWSSCPKLTMSIFGHKKSETMRTHNTIWPDYLDHVPFNFREKRNVFLRGNGKKNVALSMPEQISVQLVTSPTAQQHCMHIYIENSIGVWITPLKKIIYSMSVHFRWHHN